MSLPSDCEKFFKKVFDPSNNLVELVEAKSVLDKFISDMDRGILPISKIKDVEMAFEKISTYAGYPYEAYEVDMFLKFDSGSSYREIFNILKLNMPKINGLISDRLKISSGENNFFA